MEDPVREIPGIIHALCETSPSQQKAALYANFTPDASFTHPFCATSSWSLSPTLNSRWALLKIYQWYKIMSPHISLEVLSVTFNEDRLKMYVDVHQHFRAWPLPFYDKQVWFTTVLTLAVGDETGPESAVLTKGTGKDGRKHGTRAVVGSQSQGEPQHPSYAAVADPKKPTHVSDDGANALVNGDGHSDEKPQRKRLYYITSQDDLYQTNEWIKFISFLGIAHPLVVAWMFFATLFSIVGSYVWFPLTWAMETGRVKPRGKRIEHARR